jgi:hypothetical protein
MKILEQGIWKKPWSLEIRCDERSCGAKLLIEEGDIRAIDYDHDYYVLCPICKHQMRIVAKDIPLRVSEPADKKRKWRDSS